MGDFLIALSMLSILGSIAAGIALIVAALRPQTFEGFIWVKKGGYHPAFIFGGCCIALLVVSIVAAVVGIAELADSDSLAVTEGASGRRKGVPREDRSLSPAEYEIVLTEKGFSMYDDKGMRYAAVVSPQIRFSQVKPTVDQIIDDIVTEDEEIGQISLFLYSDAKLVGEVYDVATAVWAPGGKLGTITPEIASANDRSSYRTTITIKENLGEYLTQRGMSEEKFGFSEEERRRIFLELVGAVDRAADEAESKYPLTYDDPNYKAENLKKYSTLQYELEAKYEAEVRAKYQITEEVEDSITIEGLIERWPMPKHSSDQ